MNREQKSAKEWLKGRNCALCLNTQAHVKFWSEEFQTYVPLCFAHAKSCKQVSPSALNGFPNDGTANDVDDYSVSRDSTPYKCFDKKARKDDEPI